MWFVYVYVCGWMCTGSEEQFEEGVIDPAVKFVPVLLHRTDDSEPERLREVDTRFVVFTDAPYCVSFRLDMYFRTFLRERE